MSRPIRVVVADDSPIVCRLIASYLRSDPEIEVVATVLDGARAIEAVAELRPDAVTLDLEMPSTNGLEAVQRIMATCPTPILVVSGVSGRAATMTMQALDFGAVDFVLKYQPGMTTDPRMLRDEIVAKIHQAAGIRVVRTVSPRASTRSPIATPARPSMDGLEGGLRDFQIAPLRIAVVGASTGGPVAIRQLLAQLPSDLGIGVVVVQHIPATFTGALAAQLQRFTKLEVREAVEGQLPAAGSVLIAPGGTHLLFGSDHRIQLRDGPKVEGHRPSIDVAMQSAAQSFGANASGVILTGMGNDGVSGLLAIRTRGGATFAQDRESCVVYGMPRCAIEAGLVDHVAPPWRLAQLLATPAASSSVEPSVIEPRHDSESRMAAAVQR